MDSIAWVALASALGGGLAAAVGGFAVSLIQEHRRRAQEVQVLRAHLKATGAALELLDSRFDEILNRRRPATTLESEELFAAYYRERGWIGCEPSLELTSGLVALGSLQDRIRGRIRLAKRAEAGDHLTIQIPMAKRHTLEASRWVTYCVGLVRELEESLPPWATGG